MKRPSHKKSPPFAFVLDELAVSPLAPSLRTRPMFGCLAVYTAQRIVFILRKKGATSTMRDDGIWIATLPEHNASLRRELPLLRPVELFDRQNGKGLYGWLNLPADEEGFEAAALHACRMVIRGDARIGKIPKSRRGLK